MNLSVVILNWNGKHFLRTCLPSVIEAAGEYANNCQISVVDNGSNDGSIEYLRSNFPQVEIVALEKNLGFSAAMNIGFKKANGNIVIGLNNDIVVDKGFILPLVNSFIKDDAIFAVAAKMLLEDKKTLNFGRAKGDFNLGIFRRTIDDTPAFSNTLYACAGGFAVNKDRFFELDGFDDDMNVYWEDADLCYRAWKKGWRTVYEPRSIIYHKLHGTYLKKWGSKRIDAKSGENYALFILKNVHDRVFFYKHILFLPALMLACLFCGRPGFSWGLLRSVRRWPAFFKKRSAERKKAVLSDRQILKILNS
jgi:GT2 family glycosyltransferase